jgi:hypothetical protein
MSYRPGGVLALAILFIIFGVLGVVGAIGYLIVATSAMSGAIAVTLALVYLAQMSAQSSGIPLQPSGFSFFLTFGPMSTAQYNLSASYFALVLGVIFAALFILTAVGLLRMKNWGRILALIFGILCIIGGAIGLLAIVGIIPLAFGIIVVAYLMGSVKDEFE